jgi:hypothetical protein
VLAQAINAELKTAFNQAIIRTTLDSEIELGVDWRTRLEEALSDREKMRHFDSERLALGTPKASPASADAPIATPETPAAAGPTIRFTKPQALGYHQRSADCWHSIGRIDEVSTQHIEPRCEQIVRATNTKPLSG